MTKRLLWVAVAAATTVGACCCGEECKSNKPVIIFRQPVQGQELTLADDVRQELNGLQVDIEADVVNVVDGSLARLFFDNAEVLLDAESAKVRKGILKFTAVAVPDGEHTLRIDVSDTNTKLGATAQVTVTADSSKVACRIVDPRDGSKLTKENDAVPATPTFQYNVAVRCGGIQAGNTLSLSVNGRRPATVPLDLGGFATVLGVELEEGSNELVAKAESNSGDKAEGKAVVTVDTGACQARLAPTDGTIFNARGEPQDDLHVRDNTLGPPMNGTLTVTSDCEGASVEVRATGVSGVFAAGTITGGAAEMNVTFPHDGEFSVAATVSGGGKSGQSLQAAYTVDSVVPNIDIVQPVPGHTYTDRNDADPAAGFQMDVTGVVEGLAPGQQVAIRGDNGVPVTAEVRSDLKFTARMTFANGTHTVEARAVRPSGTTAVDAVSFSVDYRAAAVNLANVAGKNTLTAADDYEELVPGFQVAFDVSATGLNGDTGRLTCSGVGQDFTVGDAGTARVVLTVPTGSCAGAVYSCTSRVTTSGGQSYESTPPLTLLVDTIPPVVTLLLPDDGAVIATNAVQVSVVTSCPNEPQRIQVLVNGNEEIDRALSTNAFQDTVLIASGSSQKIEVVITDAAGNIGRGQATVQVDADAPDVLFMDPPPTGCTVWTQDEQGGLEDGFQHDVAASVNNEELDALVELSVNGRAPIAKHTVTEGANRVARWAKLLVPEGPITFEACAEDVAGSRTCRQACAEVQTTRPICNITEPNDGQALGLADDRDANVAGVQRDVFVQTDAADGETVVLTLIAPDNQRIDLSDSVSNGAGGVVLVAFAAQTFDLEGEYTLEATCGTGGTALPNKVALDLTAPEVEFVAPLDGKVFNLADEDRGVAAGFQIDVKLAGTGVTARATAELTVDCGGIPDVLAAPFNTLFEASFRSVAVVEDGSCTLTAKAVDLAGNESVPVSAHIIIDRIAPTVEVLDPPATREPPTGAPYGKADDADGSTPTTFEFSRLKARVTGAARESITMQLNGGTPFAPPTIFPASAPDQVWADRVTMSEGVNTLVVSAGDAHGNTATGQRTFEVDTTAPTVAIVGPRTGAVLNRALDVSTAAGGQFDFLLNTGGVIDGTDSEVCTDSALAETGLCSDGSGTLHSMPPKGQVYSNVGRINGAQTPEGTQLVYGVVRDRAGNTTVSAPITVRVDTVPPAIVAITVAEDVNNDKILNAAEDTNAAAGFQATVTVEVSGMTGETGRTVTLYTTNPQQRTKLGGPVAVDANNKATFAVNPLLEGGHKLYAETTDSAGNVAASPDNVIAGITPVVLNISVDTLPPRLSILTPRGTLLKKDDKDTNLAGLQVTAELDSDAIGLSPQLLLDGAIFDTPILIGSNGRGTKDVTFPAATQGAHTLTARVTDASNNTTTSLGSDVFIDTLAPTVTLDQPFDGATLTADADGATDGFQAQVTVTYGLVEDGRTISIESTLGGQVGTITTGGGSPKSTTVTLANGAQQLTARVSDTNGNESTDDAGVTVGGGGAIVYFESPSGNPVFYGQSADTDTNAAGCQVDVVVHADSGTVELLVGSTVVGTQAASNNRATFTSVTIPEGTGLLKAHVASSWAPSKNVTCDLVAPVVTVVSPVPGQGNVVRYVAAGDPRNGTGGYYADKYPGGNLETDFTVRVSGAAGGHIDIGSDAGDGNVASVAIPSGATEPYEVVINNVVLTTGLTHALTVSALDVAGNPADAFIDAIVDVLAPGVITLTPTLTDARKATVHLAWNAPGSDGATGLAAASYEIKKSETPINTEAAWAAATPVTGTIPAPANGGTPQGMDEDKLALEKTWHFAARALDALGNLSPLAPDAFVSTSLTRLQAAPPPEGLTGLGNAIAVGDLDGDNKADVVVGANANETSRGAIVVIYGAADGNFERHLIKGPQAGSSFGYSVAIVPDVNGDNRPDILVGANAEGGTPTVGAAYLYLSRPQRYADNATPDVRFAGTPAVGGQFGTAVAGIGDFDGDTKNDIAIGAFLDNGAKGLVFIYKGRTTWPTDIAAAAADVTISDPNSGALLGLAIAPIDVDAAAPMDIAIAAGGGATATRGVRIVKGRTSPPQFIVMGTTAGTFTILPPAPVSTLFSLATGDFNGDQRNDLAVGDAGSPRKVHIYDGATLDTTPTRLGEVTQDSTAPNFGGSLAFASDLNADGKADLIIGSTGTTTRPDKFWIVFGKTGTVASTGDLVFSGSNQYGRGLGAGDVTGTSAVDIVVGAPGGSGSVQILH